MVFEIKIFLLISGIFRGIKTTCLILRTFLSILCLQDTSLKVVLTGINEHLLLLLESGFSGY